ncbi:hypothetical protein HDV06_001728 [Boothiomyces sp. JEL0866]|nr:hypothetical protein HDV06_001728 [Boothiomyces sp. JEL0866]
MRRNRILKYLIFFSVILVILYTLRFKQQSWATFELYTELKQEFTFVKSKILKEPIPKYSGNGIVMTLTDKSINLTILYLNHLQKHLKTELPIQVFYNKDEFTKFDLLNVEYQEFKKEGYLFQEGSKSIKPFYYKNLAIIQSRFENVLFLDQDNLVLRNPDFIFESPEFKSTGMIVWKDNFVNKCSTPLYKILDLPCRFEFEKESGQFLVNKSIHYHSLRLSTYLTQHDKYQQDRRMLYGDKDTFHLSADALGKSYNTVPYVITQVGDYNNGMCGYAMLQKWFDGKPLFLHTNGLKGRKTCAKLDHYSIPIFYLGGMDFDYGGEKGCNRYKFGSFHYKIKDKGVCSHNLVGGSEIYFSGVEIGWREKQSTVRKTVGQKNWESMKRKYDDDVLFNLYNKIDPQNSYPFVSIVVGSELQTIFNNLQHSLIVNETTALLFHNFCLSDLNNIREFCETVSLVSFDELCTENALSSPVKSARVDGNDKLSFSIVEQNDQKVEAVMDVDPSPPFEEEAIQKIDITLDQLKGLEGSQSTVQLESTSSSYLGNSTIEQSNTVDSQTPLSHDQNLELELETQERSEWTQENKWDTESVIFENTTTDFKAVDDLYFAIKNQMQAFSLELKQEQSRSKEKELTIHKLRESLKKLEIDLTKKKFDYQVEIEKFKTQIKEMKADHLLEISTTELVANTMMNSILSECNTKIDSLSLALKELEYLKKLELTLTAQVSELQTKVSQNEELEKEYLSLKGQLETEIANNSKLLKLENQISSDQQDQLQQKLSEIQVLEKIICELETKNTDKEKELQLTVEACAADKSNFELLYVECESLKQNLQVLRNEKENLVHQIDSLSNQNGRYEQNLAELRNQLAESRSGLEGLQSMYSKMQVELEQSHYQINEKTKEIERLKDHLQSDLNSMSGSQQEIESQSRLIGGLTASVNELQASITTKEQQLEKHMDEKSELLQSINELEVKYQNEQENYSQSLMKITELQGEFVKINLEKDSLEQMMQTMKSEMKVQAQSIQNIQQIKSEKERVEVELQQLIAENQQIQSTITTLNGQLAIINGQLESSIMEKQELITSINQLKGELEQSREMKFKYEDLEIQYRTLNEKAALWQGQAEFKEKYDELTSEYEKVLLQIDSLKEIQGKYDDLCSQLADRTEKYEQLQKEVDLGYEIKQKYDDLNIQYSNQVERYVAQEKEVEATKVEMKSTKEKLQQIQVEQSALLEKCTALQQTCEENKTLMQDQEAKCNLAYAELKEQIEKYAILESEQASHIFSIQELKLELENSKLKIEEIELEKSSLKDEFESKLSYIKQLELKLEQSVSVDIDEKLDELNMEIRLLNDRNITLQSEKSNLEYESSMKDSEIIQLKNERSQLNSVIAEKDGAIQQNNQLTSTLQSLKESVDYLEKEKQKFLDTIKFSEQEQNSTNELLEKEMQKCADYEEKLEGLNMQISNMQSEISRVESLEKECKELKSASSDLRKDIEQKKVKINLLEKDLASKQENETLVAKLKAEIELLNASDESHRRNIGKLQVQLQQFQLEYTQVLELNKDLQKEREQTLEKFNIQSSDLDALKLQNLDLEKKAAKYDVLVQEYSKLQEKLSESTKAYKQLEALKTQNLELVKSVQSQRNVITNINAELSQVKLAQKPVKKKVAPKMGTIPEVDTPKKTDENAEMETDSQEKKRKPKRRRESILLDANNDLQDDEEEGELTPLKRKSVEPEETPESQRITRTRNRGNVYILLSGFKENTAFDGKLRQKLVQCAESLTGVEIIKETEGKAIFDKRTTHVICPPNTRTLKILAASLSGAWIINSPDWLINSHSKNKLLDENLFGFKSNSNPLLGKKIFKSKSFNDLVNENRGTAYAQYPKFLDVLLRKVSNGSFVTDPDEADYVMEAENDPSKYKKAVKLTWADLIDLIPMGN